jgi:transposase
MREINRSQTVISHFLGSPHAYGNKNPGGRPKKITKKTVRHIGRVLARNRFSTAADFVSATDAPVRPRTMRNYLRDKGLRFLSLRKAPFLTTAHKEKRLEFARKMAGFGEGWKKVVFSDEKKFNLDGPDGVFHYWADPKLDRAIFSTRSSRAGGVMVWACISSTGTMMLEPISGNLNSEGYTSMLERLGAIEFLRKDYIFQQDNASIHVSSSAREFFERQNVRLLSWPACSPDLNIIENVWSWMAKAVYSDNKHFSSKKELLKAIQDAWKLIPKEYIVQLYDSIPKRIFELGVKRGGNISY